MTGLTHPSSHMSSTNEEPWRVLLAEDEPTQRFGLAQQLGRKGYAVETASCGEEALVRVLDGKFHILITDWDMPGMDGTTLCRRVRAAKLPGYLYILMLTAHTDVSDLVAGLEAGADDYVRKPANDAELIARVKAGCRVVQLERQVHRLSVTDVLVGTYNRRYLIEELPREIERARRYHRPVGLVMVDLDWFKQINDRHGHAVGDEVLRGFATRIRTSLRQSSDWVARYGGEEFVLVLPETALEEAAQVAEKIRLDCASRTFPTVTGELVVTASFGVTALTSGSDSAIGADTLLRRADEALYISKHSGRNRVSVASDSQ